MESGWHHENLPQARPRAVAQTACLHAAQPAGGAGAAAQGGGASQEQQGAAARAAVGAQAGTGVIGAGRPAVPWAQRRRAAESLERRGFTRQT